jgi:hypothetical protein
MPQLPAFLAASVIPHGGPLATARAASKTGPPMPLPSWPSPPPPTEHIQPLLGGEITLRRPLQGVLWQVGFASPYELVLRRDGELVGRRNRGIHHPVMLWAHDRIPSLNGALGSNLDLLVCEVRVGPEHPPRVDVVDVWERRQQALVEHASLREVCARARLEPPTVALLGEVGTVGDLQARVMALGAPGTQLEARREDGGLVTARALVVVGTARPRGRRG